MVVEVLSISDKTNIEIKYREIDNLGNIYWRLTSILITKISFSDNICYSFYAFFHLFNAFRDHKF